MKLLAGGLLPRSSLSSGGSSASRLAVSMSCRFIWGLAKTEGHDDDAEDVAMLGEADISGVVSVARNGFFLPFAPVD